MDTTDFQDLPSWLQTYINDRYGTYDINGEEAFESWPEEMQELPPEQIKDILSGKDISHKLPKSQFPEQADDLDNTMLEDSDINRDRGAKVMSDEEINAAEDDLINEIEELSEATSEVDFLGIFGSGLAIGIPIMSAVDVASKVKGGDIEAKEIIPYFVNNHGKRTLTYIVIGSAIASSSAIIVSAGVGALLFKNRNILNKIREYYKKDNELWGDLDRYKDINDKDLWK